MALIVFLIRIVLILFVLALTSILIKPFEFEFVTMLVLCLGFIVSIWWTTFHLKRKTPPALYIPRIGMFLGSTIFITGLLGLTGLYFETGNPPLTSLFRD